MPIAMEEVQPPSLAGPVNVGILPTPYRSALVDTRMKPVNSMITHIPGAAWITDYFSGVYGSSDQMLAFDIKLNPVLQQYLRIKNYELKLQAGLDIQVDPQTQILSASGTAMTYPYLTPNVNDCFIADIGDGRSGLFTVTSSSPKNVMNETCHEINFVLRTIMSSEIDANLETKVVKDCEFIRDFITYGQNPVIVSEEVSLIREIEKMSTSLLNVWFARFFSEERGTLLVGGMDATTYDPFVLKMLMMICDVDVHPFMRKIKQLNVDDQQTMRHLSIWDVLINRDMNMMPLIFQQATAVPVSFYNNFHLFKSIYFSRIQQCVYPIGSGSNIDDRYSGQVNNVFGAPIIDSDGIPWTAPSDSSIPLKGMDSYYVLSPDFYNNATVLTEFEAMIRSYLGRQYVLPDTLLKYCSIVQTMPPFEQFYYIPILVILLKAKIREW